MSLDRIAVAKRAVPRTGVSNIDEEAIILYSCLSRMDVALSRALANDGKKKTQTIAGPTGDRIDVTGRTSFGRPLLESGGNAEEEEALVFKSDSNVASGALLRMAQHASFAFKDLKRMATENEELKILLAKKDEELSVLRKDVETLREQVSGRENPETLFQWYKASWAQQHQQGQALVTSRHNEKEDAISSFVAKHKGSSGRTKNVSMFRLLYHTSEDLLANEFRPADDAEIDKVVQMFQRPATVVGAGSGAHAGGAKKSKRSALREREMRLATLTGTFPGAMPDEQAAVGLALALRKGIPGAINPLATKSPRASPTQSELDLDNLDDVPMDFQDDLGGHRSHLEDVDTSRIIPPSQKDRDIAGNQASAFLRQLHGLDLHKANKLRVEDFDADTQDLSAESLKKAAAVNLTRAKTRSTQNVKSASLVVTFYVNKNIRKIAKLDDAGTLMYQLRNILVEAPTTYSNLVVDRGTLAGKSEVVSGQAAAVNLTSLWDDICSFDSPVVRVIQLDGPDSSLSDLQETLERAPHVSDMKSQNAPQSDVAHQKRINLLKFFRNSSLAEKTVENGSDEELPLHLHPQALAAAYDLPPRIVTNKQKPGILYFLATGGEAPGRWQSPIQSTLARCYASSMVDVCTPDALVSPFKDVRSPFFMTLDEPMSSVTVSLDHAVIVPSGYSMCSVHPIAGGLYPRSWKVEASSDNVHWTLLRAHECDESLNRYNPTYHWSLSRAVRGQPYFQHFRFTQTGPNACGTHNFCMSGIELYGRVMFVEKLAVPKSSQIDMKVDRTGFSSFGPLPPPKVVDAGGAKGKGKKK